MCNICDNTYSVRVRCALNIHYKSEDKSLDSFTKNRFKIILPTLIFTVYVCIFDKFIQCVQCICILIRFVLSVLQLLTCPSIFLLKIMTPSVSLYYI